jgi:DNA polymerase I-like protein with 3'-5' exonuclease and polymerase domains
VSFESPCVDFDVETTSLQWYAGETFMLQALAPTNPADLAHVAVCELDTPDDYRRAQGILDYAETHQLGLRAHNAKFDLHFAKAAGLRLPPDHLWHDSETLVKLADERVSAALKATGDRVFGEGESALQQQVQATLAAQRAANRKASKETGEEMIWPNYRTVWKENPDLMREYAAYDVVLQRRLSEHFQNIVRRDQKLIDLYDLERDTMVALFWAEDRGVPVDRGALVALEQDLLGKFEALTQKLRHLAGIDTFNPNSPKQVGEALTRRGADTSRMGRTKSGQLKTENEDLVSANDPLADAILEYRSVYKLLNTYVAPSLHTTYTKDKGPRAPYLTSQDRIHADFRTWGARTGRMSCATPNMQNIPRDDLRLRYTWQAREGNVLVTADMDQIEARLMAAYAGEGRLLSAFRDGEDVHQLTADMVGLRDFKRAGGAVEPARQRGKRFGYAVMYGAGKTSLKKNFLTDDAGARRMLDRYHQAFPEVANLQDRIAYQLAENGYIRTKYGRKQRRDDVPWDVSYKYLNYLLQGTAADMIKQAVVRCHKAGVPIVAVVHDEIVADVPREDAEEAAVTIREALVDFPEVTSHVPLDADAKIVERWSDAKTKGDAPNFAPDYMEAT